MVVGAAFKLKYAHNVCTLVFHQVYTRICSLPVVPHKEAAEVSKKGNL